MIEVAEISALLEDGSVAQVIVSLSVGCPCSLAVNGLGMNGRVFEGSDLFEALMRLRKHLEGDGILLLCAGARVDTYPSGMARSMGQARKAYVCELGKPATELVDIFDEALPSNIGTVEEQQHFHQRWMASFREKLQ